MGNSKASSIMTGGLYTEAGKTPSLKKQYNKTYDAYLKYLPQISGANRAEIMPDAQANLAATQATMPGYNALNLQQLQQYGLPSAQVGQQIANSNSLAGAQTNVNLLGGAGGQAARDATALSRELNPAYWGVQDNASRQANNLLNSFNINGLSPGEQNATERAINQGGQGSGNLGLINNTNTLSNALNFGGAFNTKQALMGNAIGTANQTAQSAMNNGINPTQIALGTSQANQGTSFQNPNYNPLAGVGSSGNGLLESLSGLSGSNMQLQAKNNYDNSSQGGYNTFTQGVGNACCFIFLESYNGVLPWYVRVERDRYYQQEPAVAAGYKKMAAWLVPLMRRYAVVKHLVNLIMVKPLTLYGGHTHKVNYYGHIFWPVKKFWFTIWKKEGK